jgi:hypothetical protein
MLNYHSTLCETTWQMILDWLLTPRALQNIQETLCPQNPMQKSDCAESQCRPYLEFFAPFIYCPLRFSVNGAYQKHLVSFPKNHEPWHQP